VTLADEVVGVARVPLQLKAPEVSWQRDVDVVVLGSGAAGLAAAIAARPVRSVLIVTKDTLDAGSTAWAQGGLAGVLDPTDSIDNHVRAGPRCSARSTSRPSPRASTC